MGKHFEKFFFSKKVYLIVSVLFLLSFVSAFSASGGGIDANFVLIQDASGNANNGGVDANFILTDTVTGNFNGGGVDANLGVYFSELVSGIENIVSLAFHVSSATCDMIQIIFLVLIATAVILILIIAKSGEFNVGIIILLISISIIALIIAMISGGFISSICV